MTQSTASSHDAEISPSQGLWRTTLAGPGRSLGDAFANLERSPQVERVQRHAARNLLSARVTLTPEEGQGSWELLRIRDDLFVIVTNFTYKEPRFEFVPGDGLVQFNFTISGDLTYAISRRESLRFNRPSLHLWKQPPGIDMREWTAPKSHERTVSISMRPEFLRQQLLDSGAEVPARLRPFLAPEGDRIAWCQLPLTPTMFDAIGKLIDHSYRGALGLLYMETLTFQLLCAAIGHLIASPERPDARYSERALRALNKARDLLLQQFSPPPALGTLSRRVGMAEKTLTRAFKAVYGETIFDFGLRCRMQHAMTLLRDRGLSIDRVSEAVGYAHPTSFAAAFRRHFGTRPSDLKGPQGVAGSNGSAGRKPGRNS